MTKLTKIHEEEYRKLISRLKDELLLIYDVIAVVESMMHLDAEKHSANLTGGVTGHGTYETAVGILGNDRRPFTTSELKEEFTARGFRFNVAALYGAVQNRKNCQIVRVGRGTWAVKDPVLLPDDETEADVAVDLEVIDNS